MRKQTSPKTGAVKEAQEITPGHISHTIERKVIEMEKRKVIDMGKIKAGKVSPETGVVHAESTVTFPSLYTPHTIEREVIVLKNPRIIKILRTSKAPPYHK